VMAALYEAGTLLAKGQYVHSYPHSWRSKAPLIFRTTPQWFIAMEDGNQIRTKSLAAIKDTRWVPVAGENRIRAMVETRPDWNISRQRTWGVPIAIFMHKETFEPLRDADVCKHIVDIFKAEGSDAWFKRDAQDFLGDKYNAADFTQVFDIVDVWFESGCTHAFVCEARGIETPVDLYLEGSDQHRGWFQSSLLESVGTRGRAPFKTVLTHGFTLDEQGRKMSKSLGNVIAPQKVIEQYGADILRLWVCNTNYSEDVRIGNEILKQQADLYRRLRNTLRYLLGALADFNPSVKVEFSEMPELEKWMLHRLAELDGHVRDCLARFDYNDLFITLHEFCNSDLSAFYFDVRKDSLYCDAKTTPRRRAALWVMNQIFLYLTAWLAPILSFTTEEAWQYYAHKDTDSVHLRVMPAVPTAWRDDARGVEWEKIRRLRSVVTAELEATRANKTIGSALEAKVALTVPDAATQNLLAKIDFRDLCIVSALEIDAGRELSVVVTKMAETTKCDRCWQYLPDVGTNKNHPTICARCADAVDASAEALCA
jgi:isoleucyl-tRNA synthetase